MITPVLIALLILFIAPMLDARIRMWMQLRLYRQIQRNFFTKRVFFLPKRETPLERPMPTQYNFIEADQFIAVLKDTNRPLQEKESVLATLCAALGFLTQCQQSELRRLLETMLSAHDIPLPTTLLTDALYRLDEAVLID